ncbi:MAG: hypothetical protein AAFX09_05205 [Pseudomonadota bacterium]
MPDSNQLNERIVRQLRDMLDAWNVAEQTMKAAERCHGALIEASVNELRYAGRRIMDAMENYEAAVAAPDFEDGEVRGFLTILSEASQFCKRAHHDALDATILYFGTAIEEFEREFGPGLIATHIDEYVEFRSLMRETDELIVQARRNRSQSRDANYAEISERLLPELKRCHQALVGNQVLLTDLYEKKIEAEKRSRRDVWMDRAVGFLTGALIAVIGAILTSALAGSELTEGSARANASFEIERQSGQEN